MEVILQCLAVESMPHIQGMSIVVVRYVAICQIIVECRFCWQLRFLKYRKKIEDKNKETRLFSKAIKNCSSDSKWRRVCLNLSVPACTRFCTKNLHSEACMKEKLSMNLKALYEKVRRRSLDGPRHLNLTRLVDFGRLSRIRCRS